MVSTVLLDSGCGEYQPFTIWSNSEGVGLVVATGWCLASRVMAVDTFAAMM